MSYNNAIPTINDFVIQSAPQLRANYTQIFNSFAQDHYPMNDANQGKHRSLTLRNQIADPVTGADQVAIYNKTGTGSLPHLFYAPNNAQTPIQLDYQSIVNTGLQQRSFIAGPFIFFTGRINSPTDGQSVVLTPTTTLTAVIVICGSDDYVPKGNDNFEMVGRITGGSFTLVKDGNKLPDFVTYTAIGLVT